MTNQRATSKVTNQRAASKVTNQRAASKVTNQRAASMGSRYYIMYIRLFILKKCYNVFFLYQIKRLQALKDLHGEGKGKALKAANAFLLNSLFQD